MKTGPLKAGAIAALGRSPSVRRSCVAPHPTDPSTAPVLCKRKAALVGGRRLAGPLPIDLLLVTPRVKPP